MKEIVYGIVIFLFLFFAYNMIHCDSTEPWIDSRTLALIIAFVVVVPIGIPIMLVVTYCIKK